MVILLDEVLGHYALQSSSCALNQILEPLDLCFHLPPLFFQGFYLISPCDRRSGFCNSAVGEMFGFNFGLAGFLALTSQRAELVVVILLAIFRFGVGFDPAVSVNFTFCAHGFDVLQQAIALML